MRMRTSFDYYRLLCATTRVCGAIIKREEVQTDRGSCCGFEYTSKETDVGWIYFIGVVFDFMMSRGGLSYGD